VNLLNLWPSNKILTLPSAKKPPPLLSTSATAITAAMSHPRIVAACLKSDLSSATGTSQIEKKALNEFRPAASTAHHQLCGDVFVLGLKRLSELAMLEESSGAQAVVTSLRFF
jgi:hypothetical protein